MSLRMLLLSVLVVALIVAADSTPAQSTAEPAVTPPKGAIRPPGFGHLEVLDQPYTPVPRALQRTSPPGRYRTGRYVVTQVNVDANGQNILNDAANEPTIAVDPTNPLRIVIGWRQFDTINSNFRQAGWGYSTDGGQSWTFPGKIEPGHFRSDPVLAVDRDGVFYYNSLTNEGGFQCFVHRSWDGGVTWQQPGVFAQGGDKQWMAIDTTDGVGSGNIYAYWNEFYSICSGQFTRSTNGGDSYEPCSTIPGSPYWGTFSIAPDGTVFVCGDGFLVARSTTLKNPGSPHAWQFNTTVNLNGTLQYGLPINPDGLAGQAWIAVDPSRPGWVYLLASVDPSGADPLDVMFSRSTDNGQTWSAPLKVNGDTSTSNYQWFGTMSVSPDGRIDVVWNDTRLNPGGTNSATFYRYSTDGGFTWSNEEQITPVWNPLVGWPQQSKIGDYYHMVSDERGADLAFATTLNGEQDVYYVRLGDPKCDSAGTVELDRAAYACESTIAIEVVDCDLNADPNAVETVPVLVASSSEPAGETVTLTESGPNTSVLLGSIAVSTINAPGVLLVAPGDTITVTYTDADDGQGGTNVPVVATAPVDCTPPGISGVQVLSVGPHEAQITFNATEPVRGRVLYGLSCGSLTGTADVSSYSTTPVVNVTGLNENTGYYFAVEAEDQAGNVATDNNGGACYAFATADIPNYFTEQFSNNDLDNLSLVFTPNGSIDFYDGCVEGITALPTDPAGGTTLTLTDDSFATVNLGGGATVPLYGVSYNRFYVGSNGFITFNSGDTATVESYANHFNQPRISGLFDDLNPAAGGTVSWKQLGDRVAVTWLNVPHYGTSITNTFQIEMFYDGQITLNYLAIGISDGLAGLSAGGGVPAEFSPTDLSNMGPCEPTPPTASNGTASTAPGVPVAVVLVAIDDGLPNPPGDLSFVITSLPQHGMLADPAAGAIGSVPYTLVGGGNVVQYTPSFYYAGTDSFQFVANDGGTPPQGGDSNTATITVSVVAAPQLVYSFPLDTNPGWTVEGAWAFGQPTGGGSHARDPNSGYTGLNVYGYNLNGDYTNNMPARNLTTTAIDCSDVGNAELRFQRRLGVEASDDALVRVSSDGSNWTTVWDNNNAGYNEVSWTAVSYSIAAVADHQPTVYIRWVMGPTDTSVTYPGWNIDDVQIWGVVTPRIVGDANCDGDVGFPDINAFVLLLSNPAAWETAYPDCNPANGDVNDDGQVDFGDINPFVALLTGS